MKRTIADIAKDMTEQDNRGTAMPMLILLQVKKEYVAHDDFHGSDAEEVWVEQWSGDYSRFSSLEELIDSYNEEMEEDEKITELDDDKYEHYRMNYHWETENVFFSDKGYAEHMELNGHNYHKGKVRSYGIHAWRNPEMQEIFKLIKT